MRDYIYAIILDEDEDILTVYVTPKEYWEEEGCMDDQHSDEHITDVMDKLNLSQENEGMYMSLDGTSVDDIRWELNKYPFLKESKEFEEFLI
jgi:hypothetical protein